MKEAAESAADLPCGSAESLEAGVPAVFTLDHMFVVFTLMSSCARLLVYSFCDALSSTVFGFSDLHHVPRSCCTDITSSP
jgi:hypothetical protein